MSDTVRLNRAKAIRLKCLDCCMNQTQEVKECPIIRCPLWRYRMGKEERDDLYHETHKERKSRKQKDEDIIEE